MEAPAGADAHQLKRSDDAQHLHDRHRQRRHAHGPEQPEDVEEPPDETGNDGEANQIS